MKYRDEIDKCYGVAGMSVALAILDAEDLLIGINIDGDGLDCISMVPQFYSVGNPLLSPSSVWQDVFQRFQITLGMTIADSMCRKMLHDKGVVDKKLRQALLSAALDEGKASCQLESDEVERIFDKYFQYMLQTFKNHNVHSVIASIVDRLKADRSLSGCDVLEMLRSL
ncbi:MAG: hypothetical protein ACI4UN_08200 [Muribaculaceae bacterium]